MRLHLAIFAAVLGFADVAFAAGPAPSTPAVQLQQQPRTAMVQLGAHGVQVTQARHEELKSHAAALHQTRTPGYAVAFKGKNYQGAAVVANVNPASFNDWMEKVGQHSIGFHDDGRPGQRGGTGAFRIGKTYFDFTVPHYGDGDWGRPMSANERGAEVTYMATDKELHAFTAFYKARSLKLIKDTNGNAVAPRWNDPGPSNTKHEGCTGACTSSLNPAWMKHFQRNISALRKYGQENNVPELASITDDAAEVIGAFAARYGLSQQTSSNVLVRKNFGKSSMITVFGEQHENPIETLKWRTDTGHYPWSGLGSPGTVPDAPNSEPKASVQTQRIPLHEFAGGRQ